MKALYLLLRGLTVAVLLFAPLLGRAQATATPVLTAPTDASFLNTATPTYTGTAPANSTVRVYVDGSVLPTTTTASASGNWTLAQPTGLSQTSHRVWATAQTTGLAVSAQSATITFTVDTAAPLLLLNSPAGASGSTTHSTPIPFEVSTIEDVTGSASNIRVTNGVVTSGPTGSGYGPYSFTVTPTTPGTVTTVTLLAGAFRDRAGNPSAAQAPYSLTYVAGYTATPVLRTPANLSDLYAPHTFTGTAPAGSTVTVYLTPIGGSTQNLGTTTATSGGSFSFTPASPLASGDYNAYVTAQSSGLLVSSNSNTNRFRAINQAVYGSNSASQASTDPVIQGSTDQAILRVAIAITGGTDYPLSLQAITFTTGGSTSPADITSARLYYGNASSFSPLFGAIGSVSNPNGSFTISLPSNTSSTTLMGNTYYYYLVYNVATAAPAGNVLDATLTSVTVSGQTYAATVSDPAGSRPIVQASRTAGTALHFAGGSTPGYVAFGTAAGAQLSGYYTQTAWIKPALGTGSATYYVLGNGTGTTAAPYLSVTDDGRLGAGFGTGSGTGSGTVLAQTGPNVVAPNQWQHIAATKDATTLRVYLNGELVTSFTSSFGSSGTRVNFVGSAGTSGTGFFPGDIDEVSQWQRTLSQSELRQLRHLTLRGSEQDLVSYLQFNESGTTATDFVSSSMGTLTGGTRPSSTAPVSYGTSKLLSVTGAGNYTFSGTNAAINFSTTGGASYDVVVSRLEGLPLGTQPSAPGLKKIYTPAYWIVDRYSTSAFAANITYTLSPTDISPADAANFANTLQLFKRGSNEDGVFGEPIAANAANAAAGTVRFPVTSFSQTVIGTFGTSPLPVVLVRFTAAQEGDVARLRWTTAQELNSDYFAVEASADGRNFHPIGTVAGQGTTSGPTDYEFPDPKLLAYGAPLLYYRLRQVDRDGTSRYSPVRTVTVATTPVLTLFPNPTTGAATLTGAWPGAEVKVYDALGRKVLATAADAAGSAALALPYGMATGVYVVRIGTSALRLSVQ
ncbi:LamG-like jellyroll fold domain-containing protein [Hymenobacter rubidus]|uniref:LamG-like jellyroll fold domain-containing protein n=1 Tax=Hymenobacter rubidus TaxID=1441626 RepID=UPI00191FD8FF|nr:LamG-like jellyroll fold domain-containing protein [Hymenobacter rubidus]